MADLVRRVQAWLGCKPSFIFCIPVCATQYAKNTQICSRKVLFKFIAVTNVTFDCIPRRNTESFPIMFLIFAARRAIEETEVAEMLIFCYILVRAH